MYNITIKKIVVFGFAIFFVHNLSAILDNGSGVDGDRLSTVMKDSTNFFTDSLSKPVDWYTGGRSAYENMGTQVKPLMQNVVAPVVTDLCYAGKDIFTTAVIPAAHDAYVWGKNVATNDVIPMLKANVDDFKTTVYPEIKTTFTTKVVPGVTSTAQTLFEKAKSGIASFTAKPFVETPKPEANFFKNNMGKVVIGTVVAAVVSFYAYKAYKAYCLRKLKTGLTSGHAFEDSSAAALENSKILEIAQQS